MENGSARKTRGINGYRNDLNQKRKLVLHFDVRNTILVADSVTNVHVEQAVNSYLTGVTWGREESGRKWVWVSDKPSLCSPCPNCITYYKHREKELVKVPSDRALLRRVTGDFTQEPLGEQFYPYFATALANLRWPYPVCSNVKLTMDGEDGTQYHYILPAFFKLIQHLHSNNRDFSILIRTYGMDAPNVLQCIDDSLKGNHPRFKDNPLPYEVNLIPGKINRLETGISLERTTGTDTEESLTDEKDIYKLLCDSTGVSGYVDDFLFWQNNQYHFTAAKPHWIDPHDDKTHHIFFDDNLRVTDSDSIVNVRMFQDGVDDSKDPVSLDQKEIAKLEDACLVMADLLESTADLDYFIKKVQMCEDKYEQYLSNL